MQQLRALTIYVVTRGRRTHPPRLNRRVDAHSINLCGTKPGDAWGSTGAARSHTTLDINSRTRFHVHTHALIALTLNYWAWVGIGTTVGLLQHNSKYI